MAPALSLLEQAASDAHQVVSLLNGANEQHIHAGEIVHRAIATYRQEPEALKRFVAVLVSFGVQF
jgi:hypothetical protein